MLLNLGLAADAAAAHTNDLSVDPETPPAQSPSYSQGFSFSSLPLLSSLYKPKQADGSPQPGVITSVAMSPTSSAEDESSHQPPALNAAQISMAPMPTAQPIRKPTRTKTTYQLAHPASHARHKRLKMRPKLLLQLQQISQAPRPLPILDILPSSVYLPRLGRKFPAMFRSRNGLGPNDLIIVMSELYERTMASGPEQKSNADDEDHREVVATICQMLQEDARQKGKAEICLNFGPVWEATPLPSGSYEFVAQTDHGVQVMRWAMRGPRNRRVSAPQGIPLSDDSKRFTFSLIDPTTRRHPVIASMTKNQLEVSDVYPSSVRSANGHVTPSSNMSVISDASDDMPSDANLVTLDDGLRTLIIITGIWVAFREGWSHNFSYADSISSPTKGPASPASAKPCPFNGNIKTENSSPVDALKSPQGNANVTKPTAPTSKSRRSSTMATMAANESKSYGDLTRRSNSTGAAFMDKVKTRTASSAAGGRRNRHSMLNGAVDSNREIVVSRPQSIRQNSLEQEEAAKQPKSKPESQPLRSEEHKAAKPKPNIKADRLRAPPSDNNLAWEEDDLKDSKILNNTTNKSKKRHRLSAMFTVFHRKQEAH